MAGLRKGWHTAGFAKYTAEKVTHGVTVSGRKAVIRNNRAVVNPAGNGGKK